MGAGWTRWWKPGGDVRVFSWFDGVPIKGGHGAIIRDYHEVVCVVPPSLEPRPEEEAFVDALHFEWTFVPYGMPYRSTAPIDDVELVTHVGEIRPWPPGIDSVFAETGGQIAALIADGWEWKGDHMEKRMSCLMPKKHSVIHSLKDP